MYSMVCTGLHSYSDQMLIYSQIITTTSSSRSIAASMSIKSIITYVAFTAFLSSHDSTTALQLGTA
jgi:hypothetical protein